jgi:predicted ABC-type ATPase
MLPVDVAVARVSERVLDGGHDVPERKIRDRYDRLWALVASARDAADRTDFYDNSSAAKPFRPVAEYERGILIGEPGWPSWTPVVLTGGDKKP